MASAVKEKIMCHMTGILKALDCAICLSIIKSPVSMGCGHFFCRFCIAEVLKSNYRTPCPLCKRSFTRRSIENADQRNSIVLAAGKLALECGTLTGANIVSPDTLNNLLKDNDDTSPLSTTSSNETKEEPKLSKSRKRKSQEIDICEKVSNSRSCAPSTEAKGPKSGILSVNGRISQENKRQCQSGSQSDEEFELPSLDEMLASVEKSNSSNQQETNDKPDVQEKKISNKKSLRVSFADTAVASDSVDSSNRRVSISGNEAIENKVPENNKERTKMQSKKLKTSKLRETIQNKKNALKNKTNQIISDGNETIVNKTPESKKKSIDNSSKSSDDEKAKENINKKVNKNVDSCLSSETSSVAMSPKSSTKERSKMKPSKLRSSKASEEEALISKLNAAENFTLTVVNCRPATNSTASMDVSAECYSINETILPSLRENSDDYQMEVVQLGQKEELSHITDTAVSVQSVLSPTANKLETLSRSPGWSKVRQVGKDFRVKKFSRLQVEKNSSNTCPVESDVSEDTSGGSPCEMPKLIKITELEREESNNKAKKAGCDLVNKSDFNQSADKNESLSGHDTMTVTAEIHSQELIDSNSKESESSDKTAGNENLLNYDEAETSIVMNTNEKTQGFPHDKSIFCHQNSSSTATKVPEESIVNFNGSCIPSPDMPSLKPNAAKTLNPATDISSNSAEMEVLNESEFSKNVENSVTDTYDSHMVENDMDVDENNEHVLPVLDNAVKPYTEHMIDKVSGFNMFNKQRGIEAKSSMLSPKFTSVSKSVTTGTKTLFAADETVYFASHSQQTSQRLLEYCDNNSARNNVALVPGHALGLSRYPIPNFGFESIQNQLAPFNKLHSSEKTKVLKRTCLTLEEIQDAFNKCRNDRPVTICSLPFSSGEYRLDINVADETLNISVLKVDSFERPKGNVEKTSTLMFAEKNIQTSNSPPSPITVLPSSNAESETSQPDNYNTEKPVKNLFPYLNQYFSDTDPSQQCNILPEDNEDPLEVSEVLPYNQPSNHCVPEQEPEETSNVVESMKTLLSELQALPSKDFSLPDFRIVLERPPVENVTEPLSHNIELVEALPTEVCGPSDVQSTTDNIAVCEKGVNNVSETLSQSNELVISCVTEKANESLQYDDLPPTQVACEGDILEANKTKHMTSNKDNSSQKKSADFFEKQKDEGSVNRPSKNSSSLESKKLKAIECASKMELGKKSNSTPSQRQKTFPSSYSSGKKSRHISLMEKYSEDASDPDLAMVAELVGPLKQLAEKMDATNNAPTETSLMNEERAVNQKRPLEIFEELVLSKNHESSGISSPSQRVSRLSLKSKGNPKKFKRIQRFSCSDDSDSGKEDVAEKNSSPNRNEKILPSTSKNATSGSPTEPYSFASEDLTNGNTSDIAMEIESLDEKIKSVLTKLKDIGREDLLDSENDPGANKVSEELSSSLCDDDNDAASDDSQKSTDIFSVPPTPPDAVSSDHKTLKTSRWKN